jgi:hypothetical protein
MYNLNNQQHFIKSTDFTQKTPNILKQFMVIRSTFRLMVFNATFNNFFFFRCGSTFSVWSVYLSFLHETMVHIWLVLERCDKTFSYAILLALKLVASSSDKSKFMICSDSLSCLAIPSCKTQNPFISKIVEIHKSLAERTNI